MDMMHAGEGGKLCRTRHGRRRLHGPRRPAREERGREGLHRQGCHGPTQLEVGAHSLPSGPDPHPVAASSRHSPEPRRIAAGRGRSAGVGRGALPSTVRGRDAGEPPCAATGSRRPAQTAPGESSRTSPHGEGWPPSLRPPPLRCPATLPHAGPDTAFIRRRRSPWPEEGRSRAAGWREPAVPGPAQTQQSATMAPRRGGRRHCGPARRWPPPPWPRTEETGREGGRNGALLGQRA
ncbi:hypothetical protein PVAP13_7KG031518 [Panicum virgatum]|uniref:Uncharacterized protein n=1 Tax=Panicum virgatum TaxID=38727 RepID=A0A8T0Q9X5_PANVG|nr:hypothetical protein PVAP13_7KG031518 [Panicum virgatum]